jgi:hypothetical protein
MYDNFLPISALSLRLSCARLRSCPLLKIAIDVTGDGFKSTKAIVDIYDIFGLANQTLQGADLVRSISLHSTLRCVLKNSH